MCTKDEFVLNVDDGAVEISVRVDAVHDSDDLAIHMVAKMRRDDSDPEDCAVFAGSYRFKSLVKYSPTEGFAYNKETFRDHRNAVVRYFTAPSSGICPLPPVPRLTTYLMSQLSMEVYSLDDAGYFMRYEIPINVPGQNHGTAINIELYLTPCYDQPPF